MQFEVAVADGAALDELEHAVQKLPGVVVLRAERESLDPVEPRVLDRLEEAELVRGPRTYAMTRRERCYHSSRYDYDEGRDRDPGDFSDGGDVPF